MMKSTLEKISKELLEKEYLENKKSFRQLNKEYGLNGRTINKLLLFYGIPIRYGTEAIKSQWFGEKGKQRSIRERENIKYRIITTDGYYEVKFDGEHKSLNKGRVKEHILIMEDIIGRRLKKGEVVHHIDHNKLNNDPKNLQLMKASDHNKLHGEESGERIAKLHREGKLEIIRGEKGRIVGVLKKIILTNNLFTYENYTTFRSFYQSRHRGRTPSERPPKNSTNSR